MSRQVTENDLRVPKFYDVKLEDLEFRDDGEIVRKDRWERGIRTIASDVGLSVRSFEVHDVINTCRELANEMAGVRGAAADQIWEGIQNGYVFV